MKQIPDVVFELSSLENLLISDNQVNVVNVSGLLRLTKLATLDLQNNNIMQVPPELGNCTSLRSGQISFCSFFQVKVFYY